MSASSYRTYRPKNLAELVGQEHIITVLRNEAAANKIAHAYLFYGPRGTGKTTTARILAKIVNCQKRETDPVFAKKGEPCNECAACTTIDAGQALDVIEIDAASNRGIDEIRNLKENVQTLPSSLSHKVFIIDEVHMLTPQAFNALLKTLEEPPAHAVFILATTEFEKVPATISSRTQRLHFRKLTLQEIVAKLERIGAMENAISERPALEMIARLADGGMRDAESLFDQIASLKDGRVTVANVERVVGKVNFNRIVDMAAALIAGDRARALDILYHVHNEGHNLFQFNKDITEYIRRALSLSLNPSLEQWFTKELAQTELESIKEHAKQIDEKKHVKLVQDLITAYMQMRYNPFPIVPFEVAIIENTAHNNQKK